MLDSIKSKQFLQVKSFHGLAELYSYHYKFLHNLLWSKICYSFHQFRSSGTEGIVRSYCQSTTWRSPGSVGRWHSIPTLLENHKIGQVLKIENKKLTYGWVPKMKIVLYGKRGGDDFWLSQLYTNNSKIKARDGSAVYQLQSHSVAFNSE